VEESTHYETPNINNTLRIGDADGNSEWGERPLSRIQAALTTKDQVSVLDVRFMERLRYSGHEKGDVFTVMDAGITTKLNID